MFELRTEPDQQNFENLGPIRTGRSIEPWPWEWFSKMRFAVQIPFSHFSVIYAETHCIKREYDVEFVYDMICLPVKKYSYRTMLLVRYNLGFPRSNDCFFEFLFIRVYNCLFVIVYKFWIFSRSEKQKTHLLSKSSKHTVSHIPTVRYGSLRIVANPTTAQNMAHGFKIFGPGSNWS